MGWLDGKVAVITGAGSGMAKASTKIFIREGAKVVAAGAADSRVSEHSSGQSASLGGGTGRKRWPRATSRSSAWSQPRERPYR